MRTATPLFAALGAFLATGCQPLPEPVATPAPTTSATYRPTASQEAFIEDLSRRTFNYFWDTTDPRTCLAPDRWPSAPFSSVAAIGFALNAYGIGAELGYVS